MIRLAIALFVAAQTGCADRAEEERVVLWHAYHGAEKRALEEACAAISREGEVKLQLVQVPYGAFVDKITSAVPRGNGPDLFIFAHDRIGDWAGDVAEPIEFYVDEDLADRFAFRPLAALAWEDSLYGLPMAVKSVALYYRTDLFPEPPESTEELLAAADRLREDSDAYPLAYENTELYYHGAWLHGFGGRVLDADGAPDLQTGAAVRALELARRLRRGGAVPRDTSARGVASQFNAGRVASVISGPWFAGGIADGVPWSVAPLPVVSQTGDRARPFLGIEGVVMSARARDKQAAFEVMQALTGRESALTRARRANQLVPNLSVYEEPDLATGELSAAFRVQLDEAVLMPATPAMRQVWGPYKTALQGVIRGDADPAGALARAQREVQGYLEDAP